MLLLNVGTLGEGLIRNSAVSLRGIPQLLSTSPQSSQGSRAMGATKVVSRRSGPKSNERGPIAGTMD